MLHAELDRYWFTWDESHDGVPALLGDDALFQPLRRSEGAWYGGGRRYGLAELADTSRLPYRYDSAAAPRIDSPERRRPPAAAASAPSVSTAGAAVCSLLSP
jgi:hypothetical protein